MPAKKKTKAGHIEVHCAHDAIVDLSELTEHPKNPNRHPEGQIQLLAKIIREQGWRAPITVSNNTGFIVRGHGRYAAAKMLKVKKVPVDYQDYKDESSELADLVADNSIATYAEIDQKMLKDVVAGLVDDPIDIELVGFTTDDIDAMLADPIEQAPGPPDMELQPEEHHDYVVFMFKNKTTWMKAFQLLGLSKVTVSPHSKSQVGLGRVLNGDRLVKLLENNSDK